ncbi:MAG: hypothetical protein WD830_06650 [Chloroflexota bacterium]
MSDQRTSRSLFGLATLALTVVVGCGGSAPVVPVETGTGKPPSPSTPADSVTPNGSTSPEATTSPVNSPGANPASPSTIFDPPTPVDVDVVLDTNNTVEAVIPVEGGSITATGADGTVYTLDIPSDALLVETMIGLTPVASLTGLPFGTQTHAVQLSPDGLSLFNHAILTITPTEDLPVDEQIVFGYLEMGKDVILAAPVVDSNEIKINVLHFSGNGVTKGLLADIEPERKRLGGDAERRLQNEMAGVLAAERQRQLAGQPGQLDFAAIEAIFRQYEEQVVKPRVDAAGESCAAGQLALQTVLGLERQRQLLGMEGNGLDQYAGLIDKVGRVCVIEEFELCVEEHIFHRMIAVWLGLERQSQLLGGGAEGAIREARDLTVKCLTFRLDYESTGKNDLGGSSYESSVTSEIILRYNPDENVISGEAELVNTDYDFKFAGCTVNETTGGGTFSVFELIYVALPGASAEYDSGPEVFGHISDFIMNYHPGNSTEHASVSCPNSSTLEMPLPAWTTTFLATHIDELGESGWTAIDWEIEGGELFGEKEWSLAKGPISEEGTFELYHTPGA